MHKFLIEDMGCMSCVRDIEAALRKWDKEANVKADLKKKIIEVTSTLSPEEIAALLRAKYQVTVLA